MTNDDAVGGMNGVLPSVTDHRLLGVRVSAMTVPQMHDLIDDAVTRRERFMMVSQNLHSVYTVHRDEHLRRAQELATRIRIDGIPIVYFGRMLGLPLAPKHRTGWMDWLDPFMRTAVERGWRVHYVGSKPGIADRGGEILRERYPGLVIETDHGYFPLEPGEAAFEAVVDRVRTNAPDVLIVGMGMPRQERFLLHVYDRVDVPVLLTAGACIDYVVGVIPVPPRWLGVLGLEWVFRLVSEPRRLWRRYLLEPWFAVGLFFRDVLAQGLRRGG